jgi:hydrogenase-4 transcriptional activator
MDKHESYKEDDNFISLDEINRRHIERALILSQGRINGEDGAAELLRIKPNTLRRRMDKLGIPYGRKQKSLYLSTLIEEHKII